MSPKTNNAEPERDITVVFEQYGETTDERGMSMSDGILVIRANGRIALTQSGVWRQDTAGLKISGLNPKSVEHQDLIAEILNEQDLPAAVRQRLEILLPDERSSAGHV